MSGGFAIRQKLLAAAVLGAAIAAPPAAASPVAGALDDSIRRARRVAPELSVHVVDLESGDEIFALAPDETRILASNTKLVTSAAALDTLGPGFLFETPLLMKGRLRGDVLEGDLAVLGSGDPNFSGRHHFGDPLAVFRGWARRLVEMGARRIDGDILLYHGAFEGRRVHPDWPADQLSRCYEAPVAALSFSDNCVGVVVAPGSAPGKRARVTITPALDLFTVRNEAVTTSSSRRHLIGVERVPGTNELVVTGRVYRRARPFETWVSVNDPVEYFGAGLLQALAEEGVRISGRARAVTELPMGPWWRFAVYRSDLLSTLRVVNTNSQNFYAESVLKTLGRKLCEEGSWEAGKILVEEFLRKVGIEPGSYRLADGSGMSRGNRFSARQMTRLLEHMARHELAAEFRATLPPSGLEEHFRWRHRLAREPYRNQVFAKTGSLSGVSTLSGYARAASGKLYAFSILCNEVRSVYAARLAQDRIVRALIDHG